MRSFKVSNDPAFVAKVKDVVGLYLDPPAVDKKSQIQALDRTQPGLPLKKAAPAPCGLQRDSRFSVHSPRPHRPG